MKKTLRDPWFILAVLMLLLCGLASCQVDRGRLVKVKLAIGLSSSKGLSQTINAGELFASCDVYYTLTPANNESDVYGEVLEFTRLETSVVNDVCTASLGVVSQGFWTIELEVRQGAIVLYKGSKMAYINLNTSTVEVVVSPAKTDKGRFLIDHLLLHTLSSDLESYSVWFKLDPLVPGMGESVAATKLTPVAATGISYSANNYTWGQVELTSGMYLMTVFVVAGTEAPSGSNVIGQECMAFNVSNGATTTVRGDIDVNLLGREVSFTFEPVTLDVSVAMTSGADLEGHYYRNGTNKATATINFSADASDYEKTLVWYADDEVVATSHLGKSEACSSVVQSFFFRNAGYKTLTCSVVFDDGEVQYGDSSSVVIFVR